MALEAHRYRPEPRKEVALEVLVTDWKAMKLMNMMSMMGFELHSLLEVYPRNLRPG